MQEDKQTKVSEISISTYANYPVSLMTGGKAPFSDWRNPGSNIEPGLEEMFRRCVLIYQMYIYYILTVKRFGNEIADKVLEIQVEQFNKVSGKMAEQFYQVLKNVHGIVSGRAENPCVITTEGGNLEVPVEYSIALQFLIGLEDSPFYLTDEEYRARVVPDFRGQDFALEECLEHGGTAALKEFLVFTQEVNVTLQDTPGQRGTREPTRY